MNYGTFSTSMSISFGLYCQGLGKCLLCNLLTTTFCEDKKKTHEYTSAVDLFTRALESVEQERENERKERILLQRSSVHYLVQNYSAADKDATDALKLKCSTTGHFLKGIIAERRNLLNNAIENYQMCVDWPDVVLIPGHNRNKYETIKRVQKFRNQQQNTYSVKRGFF